MSWNLDESPESRNQSENEHFAAILAARLSRRDVIKGGLAAAAGFVGMPALLAAPAEAQAADLGTATGFGGFGFDGIAVSTQDIVRVPSGHTARVLCAWGDAIGRTGLPSGEPAFRPDASNTAAEQETQMGMHHDGMHFFPFLADSGENRSQRGLLVVNHEYTDDGLLHSDGMNTWSAAKVQKAQAAHGVSVVEVEKGANGWALKRPSTYARRVTAGTSMTLSGPAAGDDLMKTAADPTGRAVLGTLNNCSHGYTPWSTYLTCEENWNGYFAYLQTNAATGSVLKVGDGPFSSTEQTTLNSAVPVDMRRYGVGGYTFDAAGKLSAHGFGYRWHEHDTRFDAKAHPNEPNRFGWVVEFDPFDPNSVPVKRTALGRIKHEGAVSTLATDNRVVIYMGDDERNEYIYKFVSSGTYNAANRAANANLLDAGTLYVAKFKSDGSGEWLPLVFGQNGLTTANGFASQAQVLIRTRQAADRAGATMMDRPEWIAVHPTTKEVYCTLTNNSRRGGTSSNAADGSTAAASARPPVDAANPRANNVYGHIVRWRETGGDPAATTFQWDLFVQAGDPAASDAAKRGNIVGDTFGSPDGLWFDNDGRLWIQTDISTSTLNSGDYANIGNNMMLCADWRTGEIRRFLTGPKGCEVTGVVTTPDGKTMFVNIQHPGEPSSERNDPANVNAVSTWPDGVGRRPRSGTVVITRDDGGVIGAPVAGHAQVSGSATGGSSALTLSASIKLASGDAGKAGSVYVAALANGTYYLLDGSSWKKYEGGVLPVHRSVGALVDQSIEILSGVNVSSLKGALIYVGYGTSEQDMLTNRKFGLVHRVA